MGGVGGADSKYNRRTSARRPTGGHSELYNGILTQEEEFQRAFTEKNG